MPRGSAVVNVGSLAAVRPLANLTVYSMSKAALEALTKCAALELAPKGIRCVAVCCGVCCSVLYCALR